MKIQDIIVLHLFLLIGGFMQAQVKGCTDPLSKNYNPAATVNNGSCEYRSESVRPVATVKLSAEVEETSGLIKWNGALYTHNDNADLNLYAFDSVSGSVLEAIPLKGYKNQDWEEIAQDNDYIYIGDFGNNVTGNRKNLNILKVSKTSISQGDPQLEQINFSYANQTDFTALKSNVTDFDCEAMVVSKDSIYLFTKQWSSKKTSVYTLPKDAGSYVAKLKSTIDVNGLITGATYLEDKRLIVLSGYNGIVQPFFYLLYDFQGDNFFSGNKRKINMGGLSFHQVEGIATSNGIDYYVTNEHLAQKPFLNVVQKLHRFNLAPYLEDYLKNTIVVEN
ncbi:hypothetical protein AMR72_15840 [Flavobacterium psychrophilum]|nr:hypothetical protein AMR72_15840 [Flavobacterium psychrophilum]AOE53846.1 hypothetical protein ALW18_15830 [Flavobacterium psychrophilum]